MIARYVIYLFFIISMYTIPEQLGTGMVPLDLGLLVEDKH